MLKVLINSYTCCPNMGSEQGMGWNWVTSLAKTGEVELFVISEGEYSSTIERWTENEKIRMSSEGQNPNVPCCYLDKIHWYWNPVPQSTRDKCWNQGNWSFYPLYEKWQKKTADIAREICSKEKIDILHQLNMIGFREPGYLHEVSRETGIPLIWGPVDAKGSFPMAYTNGASLKVKTFLRIKNFINWMQLKWMPRVHAVAKQAAFVISASSNSKDSFSKYFNIDSPLINETGCSIVSLKGNSEKKKVNDSSFDILWVGKMDFRKQLGLALETVAQIKLDNVRLHVVGGGDDAPYRCQSERLGIEDNVIWHGAVSHEKVQELMAMSDLLLFTSVAEGTPHVVLEAMANGLPVVCHNTCGHGDSVTDECGVKIHVVNPKESMKRFCEIILNLYNNREKLADMKVNCRKRAEELSWENKAKEVLRLYTIADEERRKVNFSKM